MKKEFVVPTKLDIADFVSRLQGFGDDVLAIAEAAERLGCDGETQLRIYRIREQLAKKDTMKPEIVD